METLVFWLTMASVMVALLASCVSLYYAIEAHRYAKVAREACERIDELLEMING